MSSRTLVVGLLAMVCGVSAAVGVNQLRGKQVVPVVKEVETVSLPAAAVEIRRGQKITADMLTSRDWPKDLVPKGALLESEAILGKTASMSILVHEPILSAKLGEGKLTIPDGMRAYTILTPNDASLVAGLIEPGDRVDVLFTDKQSASSMTGGGSTAPLLQNIEVLAMGRIVDPSVEADRRNMRSVTLLVTPEMATWLALAQQMGTLQLTLRAQSDDSTAAMVAVTMRELFLRMYPPIPEEPKEEEPAPESVVVQASAEEPVQTFRDILVLTFRGNSRSSLVLQSAGNGNGNKRYLGKN